MLQVSTRDTEPAHVCKSLLDTKEQAEGEREIRQKTRHASVITALDPLEVAEPTYPEKVAVSEGLPSDRGLGIPGPVFDYQEIHRNGAYKKDMKSLTQRLFDTNSVKAFEWRTIITPMDILKTPNMNGSVAEDYKLNGHVVAYQNHDEVESGEQKRTKVTENEEMESVEPRSFSENTHCNGHMASPTGAQSNNEAAPKAEEPTAEREDAPPSQVIVVEDLTGYLLGGLRSLAAHAKGQAGFIHTHIGSYNDNSTAVDPAARPKAIELVKRTLIYHFADPARLSKFVQHNKALAAGYAFPPNLAQYLTKDGLVGITVNSFTHWVPLIGPLLLDSLWKSLGALFVPPPDIVARCGHHSSESEEAEYVPDAEASGMIYIAILALVGSGYVLNDKSQSMVSDLRAWGRTLANSHQWGKPDPLAEPWLDIADNLEYEPAMRLASRIAHVVAARRSFWLISQTMSNASSDGRFPLMSTIITQLRNQLLLDRLTKKGPGLRSSGVPFYLLEWMRTTILKTWNGEVMVKRWDGTGAAIEFIADLCMFI